MTRRSQGSLKTLITKRDAEWRAFSKLIESQAIFTFHVMDMDPSFIGWSAKDIVYLQLSRNARYVSSHLWAQVRRLKIWRIWYQQLGGLQFWKGDWRSVYGDYLYILFGHYWEEHDWWEQLKREGILYLHGKAERGYLGPTAHGLL